MIGPLLVVFAVAVVLAFAGSLLWRKARVRGWRVLGALVLGPAAACVSGLLFHAGAALIAFAGQLLPLGIPGATSGLGAWLLYGVEAAALPAVVFVVLVVVFAILTGMGPETVVTHFLDGDEMDTFLTGSGCTDALGCATGLVMLLGPLPYGLLFGGWGFALGGLYRLFGVDAWALQDPLSFGVLLVVLWAGSLAAALRR